MEKIISEHLQDEVVKNHLLLSPYLSLRFIEGEVAYAGRVYINNNLSIIGINYNSQRFLFLDKANLYNPYKLNKLMVMSSNFNLHSELADYFIYKYRGLQVELKYQEKEELFSYYIGDINLQDFIIFTKDGKIKQLGVKKFYYNVVNKVVRIKDNNRYITDLIEQNIQEYEIIRYDGKKLTLLFSFYPDGSLKKYGTLLNSKRDGLFYDSDESGKFEISYYFDGKPHGFYFSSFTQEQGFYENGVKVGF